MSIHEKLLKARLAIRGHEIKKTGKNQNRRFFEMFDFFPIIEKEFAAQGLVGMVTFTQELATLIIYEVTEGAQLTITSPMGTAQLPGCHEVQNIGAVESYQRRYLWLAAGEIMEHDPIDNAEILPTEGKKEGRKPNPATKKEWNALTETQRISLTDMVTAINDSLEIKDDQEAARLFYNHIGATAGLDANEAMQAVWSCYASDERTRITNAHNYLKQQKGE